MVTIRVRDRLIWCYTANIQHGSWGGRQPRTEGKSKMARSSRRSLFLVVFFLVACGFLGIVFAQRSGQSSSLTESDVKDSLKQFTDVYSVIEENYAEPVNPDKAIYNGAIPGMLHSLDPHSNFFDPKSYALMRE